MDVARLMGPHNGLHIAKFICREVPIRIAHIITIIDGLPEFLKVLPFLKTVRHWYLETLDDLLFISKYIEPLRNGSEETSFYVRHLYDVAKRILKRHEGVVLSISLAISDLKRDGQDVFDPKLQAFLDRLFMSRIGTRVVLHQFTNVYEHFANVSTDEASLANIGVFEQHVDIPALIEEAALNARSLMMKTYMDAPVVNVTYPQLKDENQSITFSYIPSHLYHIVFELLKNSLRATVEFHKQDDFIPAIDIVVVKGKEDITVKISDQGGGIPRSALPRLFSYFYTTANTEDAFDALRNGLSDMNHAPLAGFGYGLPLSRLYAQYFEGDLQLISMEGYGLDAYVYLKSLPANARERVVECTS